MSRGVHLVEATSFEFDPDELLSETHGGILILRINRPKAYNAWTEALRVELGRRVTAADQNADVDAVVLTGTGDKAFCAGQDLGELRFADGPRMERWFEKFI